MEPITITDPYTLSILAMGSLVCRDESPTPELFLLNLIDSQARELYEELAESVIRSPRELRDLQMRMSVN